ncbi:cystathionine gamma-synthase family protein [Phenylobacterium sp. LjRoot219]|uniref:cystathionine gamma-synthase family protein n=1 Tax=Phenylobacterium sp. LjRoot219 TaxID=3342283 RepID=UPI003ED1733F
MATRKTGTAGAGGEGLAPETLMLSYGFDPTLSEGAVKTPIFLTSTFAYRTCEEGKQLFDYLSGRAPLPPGMQPGLIYTRFNNPNLQIVEERLAILEQADACTVFSSGMAAITTVLLAAVAPGQVVLRSRPLYGGTETLFDSLLAGLGLKSVSFRDGVDPAAVREAADAALALGPVAAIFVETPANPTNAVVDLQLMAQVAAEIAERQPQRPWLIVDNTLLGPLHQAPLAHGADAVVYSLTKYVGGHSDLIAGAALGPAELMRKVRATRNLIGNQLDVHTAWMLTRSLETLRLRMDQAFANAAAVAAWLASHPRVESLAYLGALAPGSAAAEVVARQCTAYGATFSFVVTGGEAAAFQVLDRLKVFKLAVSLGGTESLACHPGSTTHSGIPVAERQALGIAEGMIRLSIGLEAPKDLIADLEAALASLKP